MGTGRKDYTVNCVEDNKWLNKGSGGEHVEIILRRRKGSFWIAQDHLQRWKAANGI